MFTLAINTSLPKTSIALFEKGQILDESYWLSHQNEAENLMPKIDELFVKHNRKYSELKQILVVSGPGSFTGLRVGVTVANTLSYLTKAKLYSINTFEYFWSALESELDFNDEDIALLIFAGMRGVYLSKDRKHTEEKEIDLLNINEVNENLAKLKKIKIFGHLVDSQLQKIDIQDKIDLKNSFANHIKYILETKKLKKSKIVVPIYVKKPDITLSKKSLFA